MALNKKDKNEVRFFHPLEKLNTSNNRKECLINLAKKKEIVQLNLDNCTIQRMEFLSKNPTIEEVKQQGLYPLVELLNFFPKLPMLVTPLGVLEMPNQHMQNAKESFDNFCNNFWLGNINDPSAIPLKKVEGCDKTLEFEKLDIKSREVYGISYLPYLLIQEILCCYRNEPPLKKLERYVYGIIHYLDILSGFELEVAKYAFWEPPEKLAHNLPDSLKKRMQNLKKNFYKQQNTFEKCKSFSLNAAMDKFWLDSIYVNHNEVFGGYSLAQHWLVTTDQKLYEIANDLLLLPCSNGKFGYYISATREKETKNFDYWNAADKFTTEILIKRKNGKEIDNFKKKSKNIDCSINEINSSLKKWFLKNSVSR